MINGLNQEYNPVNSLQPKGKASDIAAKVENNLIREGVKMFFIRARLPVPEAVFLIFPC